MGALIQLAIVALILIGMWKVFEKAGQPGWKAIVPFYNLWILATEIAKKEAIWFVIGLIPFVNILLFIEVAKVYGKGPGFGIGLALLSPVFVPILGFGDAKYVGPTAATPPA